MAEPMSDKPAIQDTAASLPINRCERCRRRLFDGFLFGVIKCPYCNRLSEYVDKKAEEEYHAARLNGRL